MEPYESPVWEFDGDDGMALRVGIIPGKEQFGLVIVKDGEKVSPVLMFSNVKIVEAIYFVLGSGMQNVRRMADNWGPVPYLTQKTLGLFGVDKQVRRRK